MSVILTGIFLPGLIMGFREGLESFLIAVIILQYLKKSSNTTFRKNAFSGVLFQILALIGIGGILFSISKSIEKWNNYLKCGKAQLVF